jgi:chemotaxis protein MotB
MRLHHQLRRDQGRHTDDWLITYADTITLLLCLFVVILSIRTSGRTLAWDAAPPVAPSVARFVASDIAATPTGDIFGGHPPFPPAAQPTIEQNAPDSNGPEAVVAEIPTNFVPAMSESFVPETITQPIALPERFHAPAGQAAPVPFADRGDMAPAAPPPATATLPPVVERMRALGSAVIEQQGDRITTLQISSNAFFASGQAVLSGPGKAILRDVAETLRSDAFAAYHISIEGHTDDMPINTPLFQSNWELSTARASAVVRFFLELGLSPRKLSAAGYADTYPIAPNRNADGTVIAENQAKNRRVVIKLEKIDKAER